MYHPRADRICPQKLLTTRLNGGARLVHSPAEIDRLLQEYRTAPPDEKYTRRDAIFFRLSPLLLKLLGRYCALSPGCGPNCLVGDLLDEAYLSFVHLLERYDPSRHVGILGYMVNGLSWSAYNAFVRERGYIRHTVLFPEDAEDVRPTGAMPKDTEEGLLSGIDCENLLNMLTPEARELVVEHDLLGYTCGDLAPMHHRKAKTIQKALERARKKMRAKGGALTA